MSCPEAARIALLNPLVIEFIEIDEPCDNRKIAKAVIDTKSNAFINSSNRFLPDLQKFAIVLLKNRDYTLCERLLILGLFCQDTVVSCNRNMSDKIPQLIDIYSKMTENHGLKDYLLLLPKSPATQFGIFINLIANKIFHGIGNYRFFECAREFVTGIDYNPILGIEKITTNYVRAYELKCSL